MKKIHDKLASINLVEDIIFTYEGSAHLKDLNSGKYLLGNEANVKKVGLSKPDDVCGLTVRDLDQHMSKNWGNLASEIEAFDNQIKYSHELIIDKNRIFLTPSGDIFVHHMRSIQLSTLRNRFAQSLS